MAKVPLRPLDAPATPSEVSVFVEGEHFVFKTDDARAIYSFDNDKVGHSNCKGICTRLWRPVLAPTNAQTVGDWTVVIREDGSRQWAYKGKPVYTFVQDEPGDTKGDGIQGVWHLVSP
jgi:predicted lipoprotein with Yx(FWY)xxD motif